MNYLALNPAVLLSPVEDGYIAFDTKARVFHQLNPLAALLTELSDGSKTDNEVVSITQSCVPGTDPEAISQWIDEAVDVHLIRKQEQPSERNESEQLTPKALQSLASELQSSGLVQAAFLCQKQASEIEPENPDYLRYLGELAHIVGKRDEARIAYEAYIKLQPDDAEISHLLVSLRDEAAPSRVPNECIEQLYERFSTFYDSNMRDELGYVGPENMWELLAKHVKDRTELRTLDLGCGTGLSGEMIRASSSFLRGLDLSPEMVELARKRDIYDHLEVAEITDWLEKSDEEFDLILACDAFIYFGDLNQVIRPALEHLRDDGLIAFSVEKSGDSDFQLTDSGRYVHSVQHIESIAAELNLQCDYREAFLRSEYGRDVIALYVVLGSQS